MPIIMIQNSRIYRKKVKIEFLSYLEMQQYNSNPSYNLKYTAELNEETEENNQSIDVDYDSVILLLI